MISKHVSLSQESGADAPAVQRFTFNFFFFFIPIFRIRRNSSPASNIMLISGLRLRPCADREAGRQKGMLPVEISYLIQNPRSEEGAEQEEGSDPPQLLWDCRGRAVEWNVKRCHQVEELLIPSRGAAAGFNSDHQLVIHIFSYTLFCDRTYRGTRQDDKWE